MGKRFKFGGFEVPPGIIQIGSSPSGNVNYPSGKLTIICQD